MANIFRISSAVLLFVAAIAFGMQLAVAEDAPHTQPAAAAAPPGPEAMDAAAIEAAKAMTGGGAAQSPAAATALQQIVPPPATPSETSGEKSGAFVPSEVETYVPIPKKIDDPRMILHTSMGDIKVRLYAGVAPRNVRNIVELARGEREFFDIKSTKKTRRAFYSGLTFHRVLSGYLIQTGCPFGNGRGGPGYQTPDEISPALRFNKAGMVAMASMRTETEGKKDANGSQFFITLAPMPDWNDKFTIIGTVESGLEVARKIGQVKTGPTDRPIKRVFLQTIEVIDPSGVVSSAPSH